MFENVIEFRANEKYIKHNQETLPVPIKLNIPDWYKKLQHTPDFFTIKGCMPFLDTLTTGYLLKMPVSFFIEHNTTDDDGQKRTGAITGQVKFNNIFAEMNLNYKGDENVHGVKQVEGSPLLEKNNNLPIHKILNPWFIKTPPGYSCLFLPPLNNTDKRFSIIPGIVDTDIFPGEVNFPMIINCDKDSEIKSTIEIGTPYVQVIPFKREKWKMKINNISVQEKKENNFFQFKHVVNNYKKKYWHKKLWK
jgi:hypothetical protein